MNESEGFNQWTVPWAAPDGPELEALIVPLDSGSRG